MEKNFKAIPTDTYCIYSIIIFPQISLDQENYKTVKIKGFGIRFFEKKFMGTFNPNYYTPQSTQIKANTVSDAEFCLCYFA